MIGICKDRYILLKINKVMRPIHDYIIIGDGYYIFMPTRSMIKELTGNDLTILRNYCITNDRSTRDFDYLRIYVPSKFTNAIYSTNETLTLILDTWEYPIMNCDFETIWGKDDLKEDEINNVIDTITSINLGLIDEIDVLDKMIKSPEKLWINEYIDKITEIL